MKNSSLVVVGSGIKFFSHLTTETKTYITQSDKVLYLVNEPAIEEWIHLTNSNSESLENIYRSYSLRLHSYRAITHQILSEVKKNQRVCVVIYGHPTIMVQPALEAAIQAKKEGIDVLVLPGVSAEDCLFVDLMINPGSSGWQSFEATDLLIHQRSIDNRSHLILWQAGLIGELGIPKPENNNRAINVLLDYLLKYYALTDEMIVYEASQYPGFKPKIANLYIGDLCNTIISRTSLLYIPPNTSSTTDESTLRELGIN